MLHIFDALKKQQDQLDKQQAQLDLFNGVLAAQELRLNAVEDELLAYREEEQTLIAALEQERAKESACGIDKQYVAYHAGKQLHSGDVIHHGDVIKKLEDVTADIESGVYVPVPPEPKEAAEKEPEWIAKPPDFGPPDTSPGEPPPAKDE